MEQKFPLDPRRIDGIIKKQRVDIKNASIRQVNLVVQEIERELSTRFIRMEFGFPGFPADPIGTEAEAAAIKDEGVASIYPPFNGTEKFRKSASRFFKCFSDVSVPPNCMVATCGAQQGCFLSLAVTGKMSPKRNRVIFIDPGFSVNKLQIKFLGLKSDHVDVYQREKFLKGLESKLKKRDVSAVLWSSPNNPTWNVFLESELEELGRLLTKYNVVGIEDNAYYGMDFRVDYSVPSYPPFIPTVAKFTDNYIALFSSSKIFNYAGQRVGFAAISEKLAFKEFPSLVKNFGTKRFIDAFIQGGIYPTTSGVSHSGQCAVARMLNEACEGRYDFLKPLHGYATRAVYYKKTFIDNGFRLVYDRDGERPLADGFYFTVAYKKLKGWQLLRELLNYGISVTTLNTFGSERTEGVRICVSLEGESSFAPFRERVEAFARDH